MSLRYLLAAMVAMALFSSTLPAASPMPDDSVSIRYDGGSVTAAELNTYARLLGSTYANPINAYRLSPDESTRLDASDWLAQASREIVFNRHWAAANPDLRMPPLGMSILRDIESDYLECIGSNEVTRLADAVTTMSLEQARAVFRGASHEINRLPSRATRYIFKAHTAGASEEQKQALRAELEELRRQIVEDGASFSELARLHSQASSAREGGFIGNITPETKMNAAIRDFIYSLTPGEVSPVREFSNGYYLFLVESTTPGTSFTEADIETNADLSNQLLMIARRAVGDQARRDAAQRSPNASSPTAALGLQVLADGGAAPAHCTVERDLRVDQIRAHYAFVADQESALVVTEEDTQGYYDKNPNEMRRGGIWRLRRFELKPGQDSQFEVRNLEDAIRLAKDVQARLAKGEPRAGVEEEFTPRGLTVLEHRDWVRGSGIGPADMEILRLQKGEYTQVRPFEGAAVFFQVMDKREVPKAGLEEMRDYITRNVRHQKETTAKRTEGERLLMEKKAELLWQQ